jgi:hypothetical protein
MFRKAIVEDAALPAAGDNLLASTISPSQNETGYFRIYGTISISGILTVKVNSSEEKMNAGIAIGAGVAFLFDIPVTRGDVVSVLFSETTGTIGRIVIDEHSG